MKGGVKSACWGKLKLLCHHLLRELQNPCPFAADLHPWVICIVDIVKALSVLVSLG